MLEGSEDATLISTKFAGGREEFRRDHMVFRGEQRGD